MSNMQKGQSCCKDEKFKWKKEHKGNRIIVITKLLFSIHHFIPFQGSSEKLSFFPKFHCPS